MLILSLVVFLQSLSSDVPTIYALASGSGRAAIAIIRLSGPLVGDVLRSLTGRALPPARRAVVRSLRGSQGELLDKGLLLWFPRPASFTGEDMAELHVHGGKAVVRSIFSVLSSRSGLRAALPGEFTRRAFWSGKMDLAQAEGLADLAQAETEAQRRHALRQSEGAFASILSPWRARLVGISARLEAAIDFGDEPGADQQVLEPVEREVLQDLAADMTRALDTFDRGMRLREGLRLILMGLVNVGKSSVLNALSCRERAITSPRAGTTRDILEVGLDFEGYPLLLQDCAGLRPRAGNIEMEGGKRALQAARHADCVCLVTCVPRRRLPRGSGFEDLVSQAPEEVRRALIRAPSGLVVVNKRDLLPDGFPDADIPANVAVEGKRFPLLAVSAKTGAGMAALRKRIAALLQELTESGGDMPIVARERHFQALAQARDSVLRAASGTRTELQAEDIRSALCSLGRITGVVDVEEVLGRIFREFCIGK